MKSFFQLKNVYLFTIIDLSHNSLVSVMAAWVVKGGECILPAVHSAEAQPILFPSMAFPGVFQDCIILARKLHCVLTELLAHS
jgi:hypothetical protein